MFERLAADHGALRGVVFAVASPFPHKLTHKTDWSVFKAQLDTQLKALHLSLSAALSLLEAHEGTARALVLSTEYVLGAPPVKIAPYVAAKAALTAYVRILAQEWIDRGVRVHILAPGMVESALTAELPEMYLQQVAEAMPEKRLTSAEDVAAAAAFLMSEAGDALYGTVVPVSRAQRR
jgi:3-oxoacyl-[acyl-carrier protein] reductase